MTAYGNLAIAAASLGLGAVLVKPQRGFYDIKLPDGSDFNSDGFLVPQVIIREISLERTEISKHPVEQGAQITDHAFRYPSQVILNISWSNSPTQEPDTQLLLSAAAFISAQNELARTAAGAIEGIYGIANVAQSAFSGAGTDQLQAYYNTLLGIKDQFCVFTLYTGKKIYYNMMITMVSNSTDINTENSLPITCECTELLTVNTKTVVLLSANQQNQEETASPIDNGDKSLISYPYPPSTLISELIP